MNSNADAVRHFNFTYVVITTAFRPFAGENKVRAERFMTDYGVLRARLRECQP